MAPRALCAGPHKEGCRLLHKVGSRTLVDLAHPPVRLRPRSGRVQHRPVAQRPAPAQTPRRPHKGDLLRFRRLVLCITGARLLIVGRPSAIRRGRLAPQVPVTTGGHPTRDRHGHSLVLPPRAEPDPKAQTARDEVDDAVCYAGLLLRRAFENSAPDQLNPAHPLARGAPPQVRRASPAAPVRAPTGRPAPGLGVEDQPRARCRRTRAPRPA